MRYRGARLAFIALVALCLASCGGGGSGSGGATTPPPAAGPVSTAAQFPAARPTQAEAARFLAQATMGATSQEIARLTDIGFEAWFEDQTRRTGPSALAEFRALASATAPSPDPHSQGLRGNYISANEILYKALVTYDDHLRERVAFALSQIYVVSIYDGQIYDHPMTAISFYDMLRGNAFGNFRDLIEDVAKHPGMGLMLSHLGNVKGDPNTGRIPDQNFARELMQLFTIGLWQLNDDGTQRLDNSGNPIPSYTQSDIVGVSRVMTGWTWSEENATWTSRLSFYLRPTSMTTPMRASANFHEPGEKSFLGVTIAAGGDPEADLDRLLDTLVNHPNTPTFISKQLIQLLVTANPSGAYVKRVADAFRNNGQGVRGDLKAVVKAILADPEARDGRFVAQSTYGRVREPVLRMAGLQRLLRATDVDGVGFYQLIGDDPLRAIAQSPMRSRTVFNDYRPDYTPPGSELQRLGLVSPAMQLVNETTIYGWQNFIGGFLDNAGYGDCCSEAQRRTLSLRLDFSEFTPLVATPEALVDRLNLLLMSGQMSDRLRAAVLREIGKQGENSSRTGVRMGATQLKVSRAIWAIVSSPEYLVQK
ncbi:MAG: DUF1800 domain-containing protein [Hyphomonadaceae bacterium]|nr:DUF1800 domain-containing protein [Hyphomonadaceae bacterium]